MSISALFSVTGWFLLLLFGEVAQSVLTLSDNAQGFAIWSGGNSSAQNVNAMSQLVNVRIE